jgi:hypothetical protein
MALHGTHGSYDEMFAGMREMLEAGGVAVFIGFVAGPGGLRPMSFTGGLSKEISEVVDQISPSVIAGVIRGMQDFVDSRKVTVQ